MSQIRVQWGRILRPVIKLVFIVAAVGSVIALGLMGLRSIGMMFSGVFALIGSAVASMAVRRYVKIASPSFALMGLDIAAIFVGAAVGVLIAAFLSNVGLVLGLLLILVGMLGGLYLTAQTAALLTVCGGVVGMLSQDEQKQLQENINDGFVPEQFTSYQGTMYLDKTAYSLGIVRYSTTKE